MNDICKSRYIPNDMLKSAFIAISKINCSNECKEFLTINIINRVTKLLLTNYIEKNKKENKH